MKIENNVSTNMRLKPLSEYQMSDVIDTISKFNYGVFVWHYVNNICYVNEFMVERFNINFGKELYLYDYLSYKIDDNSLLSFLDSINKMRVSLTDKTVEFPVKGRSSISWVRLQMRYDKNSDTTVGIITELESKSEQQIDDDMLGNIYKATLYQINLPLCLLSNNMKLKFTNFEFTPFHQRLYKELENKIEDESSETYEEPDIKEISLLDKTLKEHTFNVKYLLRKSLREESITRSIIRYKNNEYRLYTHQKLLNSTTEQARLHKILRANELMMEIKDIVDHIDDLNEMFSYLLSKIHTVIPEGNRSCFLRLDDDSNLYLDSSYGFNEEYVEEFKLPYKKSFANLHLQNDYSRSVIVNDIQKKYSDLFPDIAGDETRFKIESNITTPVVVDNNLYGIISVDSDNNKVFDDVDLNLLDYFKLQIERAIVKFRKYRTIKKDSTEDSLTGVSNRRHLLNVLESYKDKAIIKEKTLLFVVFDIDGLKFINDTYGHNCGDQIIKQFAFVLQSNIRETDFLARIGGDEFVGIFYDVTEEIVTKRINNWINYFSNNPVEFKNETVYTKFSFGISKFPDEGTFFSELLETSDKRMYKQKKAKKRNLKST